MKRMPVNPSFCERSWGQNVLVRPLILLVGATILFCTSGCDNLDALYGRPLTGPVYSVIGKSNQGHKMIVMSNWPDLCAFIKTNTPPDGDFWLISGWTGSNRLGPGGFASFLEDGTLTRYDAPSTSVEIKGVKSAGDLFRRKYEGHLPANGIATGRAVISFDDENVLETSFRAEICDAPLFNGLM